MSKANLLAVDNERLHPRDLARREVKRFRLDRERERLPICNQSTGAKNLFVDEILEGTQREMPPQFEATKFPVWTLFAIGIFIAGLIWIFTH